MSDRQSFNEIVRIAFQSGLQSHYNPDDYHFVDDDVFLIDLSLGEISEATRTEFVKHIGRCSYCRFELARMIRADVLQLPAIEDQHNAVAIIDSTEFIARRDSNRWDAKRFILTTAASILFLAGMSLFFWPTANDLVLAQNELANGRYMSAIDHAESFLSTTGGDQAQQDEAKRVLREAAYEQSVESLSNSQFDVVKDLSRRVEEVAGSSPALTNLRVQAMRKQTSPSAWPDAGDLTQYGYRLDGRSYTKTLPSFDDSVKAVIEEYETAIAQFPEDVHLRLNYGQFLLQQENPESARIQFSAAKRFASESVAAEMGLGIAAFQVAEFDAAAKHFQTVLAQEPGNIQAMLDLAISYQRAGQTDDAMSWFNRVLKLLPDGKRSSEIRDHIGRE